MEREVQTEARESPMDPMRRDTIHFFRAISDRYAITCKENEYVGISVGARPSFTSLIFVEVYAAKADYPATLITVPELFTGRDFAEFTPTQEELLRYVQHVQNREFLAEDTKKLVLDALHTCLSGFEEKPLELPRSNVSDESLIREMISRVDRKQLSPLLYAYAKSRDLRRKEYPTEKEIDSFLHRWAEAKVNMYRLLGDLTLVRPLSMPYTSEGQRDLFYRIAIEKYPRLAPLLHELRWPYSLASGSNNNHLSKLMYRHGLYNQLPFSAITALTGEKYWESALNGILGEITSEQRSIVFSIDPIDYFSMLLQRGSAARTLSLYGENSILLYDRGPMSKTKYMRIIVKENTYVEFMGGAYFNKASCDVFYNQTAGAHEDERRMRIRAALEELLEKAYGISSDWMYLDSIGCRTEFWHSDFQKRDVPIDHKF